MQWCLREQGLQGLCSSVPDPSTGQRKADRTNTCRHGPTWAGPCLYLSARWAALWSAALGCPPGPGLRSAAPPRAGASPVPRSPLGRGRDRGRDGRAPPPPLPPVPGAGAGPCPAGAALRPRRRQPALPRGQPGTR